MLFEIGFLVLLVAINAFFAASEIALISLNNNKIKLMAEEGHKKANLLQKLLLEPSGFLATIQLGITLAGFLASAFAAESFATPISKYLIDMGVPLSRSLLETLSVVLITLILSYFTLVFGELVPKRLAMKKTEQIAMLSARPLTFISVTAAPFIKLLTLSTNFVVRLFGIDPNSNDRTVTEEEILMMVDVGRERGTIQESEKTMINRIFEFDNTYATDIMTHRTNIFAIEIGYSLDQIIQLIIDTRHTRFPVYEDHIDKIIGVLHVIDIIKYSNKNDQQPFNLRDILTQPYLTTESKKTNELLMELQMNKTHMAVIIDEYGGTAGIVTVEDLLEEIVGDIYDEHEVVVNHFTRMEDNTYSVLGTTSLDDVQEFFKTDFPVDDYETLSGFMIGQLKRIPGGQDQPVIEYNKLILTVEKSDEKRILRVKISISGN